MSRTKDESSFKGLRKNNTAAAVSVLICIVCFAAHLILGRCRYEINDDMRLNLIAAGAFGEDSQYLIFPNILYGFFLKFLYRLFPWANWYLWVMLLANFCGITSLSLFFSGGKNASPIRAAAASLLVNWLLCEQLYNSIQWTKNVSFYTILFYFFLLWYLQRKEKRFLIPAAGYLFLAIAIRKSCFLFLSPFGILAVLVFQAASEESWKVKIRRLLILSAGALVFFEILVFIQNAAYSRDGWGEFREFNHIRSTVYDYAEIEETAREHQEELEKIGISGEEIALLSRNMFDDPEFFTKERMEQISKICGGADRGVKFDAASFKAALSYMAERTATFRVCILFWAVLLFIILIVRNGFLSIQAILFAGGIFGEYLFLVGRARIVWRVEFGIWLSALLLCCVSVVLFAEKRWDYRWLQYLVFAAAMILMIRNTASLWHVFSEEKHYRIAGEEGKSYSFFRETGQDDIFYLGDGYVFMAGDWARNLFDIDEDYRDFFEQFSSLGDWDSHSPPILEKLERHGISNPFRALLTDGVRLASDDEGAEVVLRYLRKHYDSDAQVIKTGETEGIGIYQFTE